MLGSYAIRGNGTTTDSFHQRKEVWGHGLFFSLPTRGTHCALFDSDNVFGVINSSINMIFNAF